MATATKPDRLHFTGNDDADALIARDPFALLIGFALDQQVPVQTAFTGPLKIKQRLGTLDPRAIADEYDGAAERVWTDAQDGQDLKARLGALPGFGDMKVRAMLGVLPKRFGVQLNGMDEVVPKHPTLGDVDSADALAAYQEKKRAYKASLKAKQQR